jgi:tRNA dimethylallyltransferase
MLAQGLIEEVRALYTRKDITQDLPAIKAVGYRQVWDYLAGKLSFMEMQEKAIAATRQLAKRQLTWLRSWSNINWFNSEDSNLIEAICEIINKT